MSEILGGSPDKHRVMREEPSSLTPVEKDFRKKLVALWPVLLKYALHLTKNDHYMSGDLVQETILKAIENPS